MLRQSMRILCWALLCACPLASLADAKPRPNFVVFVFDDLGGQDLGAYGNPVVKTPVLDRFAGKGLRFDNAFLTISSCSASRASILTGRYPHNTGAPNLHDPVPPEQVLVSSVLKNAGYYTASIGKWHLGNAVVKQFDRTLQRESDPHKTEDWIPELQARPKDKPFFFWLATTDPHVPYDPYGPDSLHKAADVRLSPYWIDTPTTRESVARYYNEIAHADGEIGRVLDELDRQGVLDSTWIFVISDNGAPFPRAKVTLYDSGIKTPLLVQGPGVPKGRAQPGLVSVLDLAPTILDIAGVPVPASMQGRSFRLLLQGKASSFRDYIVAEQNNHAKPLSRRAIRDKQFLYIRTLLTRGDQCQLEVPEMNREWQQLNAKHALPAPFDECFRTQWPEEELYDVVADPDQMHNIAADEKYRKPLERMRARWQAWARETQDDASLKAMQAP